MLGAYSTQRRSLALHIGDCNAGKLVLLHNSKADAGLLLNFLLQILGKLLVAFHRNHGQRIYLEAPQPVAILVDTQPQTAPDCLAPLALRAHLAQRANLKHIRVVPAFTQRAVGKNKFQRGFKRQQFFLLFHNQVVCPLGVVAVALIVLLRVCPAAIPVD